MSRLNETTYPYPYNLAHELAVGRWKQTGEFDAISRVGLEAALETLDDRMQTIIRCRYQDRQTYETIAHFYSLTRERVRQIERKALTLLAHPTRADMYLCVTKADYKALECELADTRERLGVALLELSEYTDIDDDGLTMAAKMQAFKAIPITDADFSLRSYNCLNRAGILTLGEAAKYTENDLLNIRNFGTKSITELRDVLARYGLSLRNERMNNAG